MSYDYTSTYGAVMIVVAIVGLVFAHYHANRRK